MELFQVTRFPELLVSIIAKLDTAGIRYMLTGSAGMMVYTVPRLTRDVDLVIECEPADARRLVAQFGSEWYVDEAAVATAVRERRSFSVIHKDASFKADMIVRKDGEYRRQEFGRRRQLHFGEIDMWVASAEDILISKLKWAANGDSALQLRDASWLASQTRDLDWDYLRLWAGRLGLEQALEEVAPNA